MAKITNPPRDAIGQTSKTMIIEAFRRGDGVSSLDRILNAAEDKEELFDTIDRELAVHSFEEFTEKFMPEVWEWYEAASDDLKDIHFRYSLSKPPENIRASKLDLSHHDFYNMVMRLYEKKGVSAVSDKDFDYTMVANLLSPARTQENVKRLRGNLYYSYRKYLENKNGSKSERSRWKKKVQKILEEGREGYLTSVSSYVKRVLADTEEQLEASGANSTAGRGQLPGSKMRQCFPVIQDDGSIQPEWVEIISDDNTPLLSPKEKIQAEIAELVSRDFDRNCELTTGRSVIRSLILNAYVGSSGGQPLSTELLKERRDTFVPLYKNAQEEFIRAISSAVEKMLSVKAFFDHANLPDTALPRENLPSPVIITNCTASQLMNDSETKEKFKKMIDEIKNELDNRNRIWFAVLPAVYSEEFADYDNYDDDDDDDWDSWIGTNQTPSLPPASEKAVGSLDVNTMNEMMQILSGGEIITFLNFKANAETGFQKLNAKRIQEYRKELKGIGKNEYAVFVYPNFTILPKRETSIPVGRQTKKDGTGEEEVKIDIPGIYLDAAYVAAGLVVASQNPFFLKNKGFQIETGFPTVRFDFEEGDNRFILPTVMNREGRYAWDSDIEKEISEDRFGFCFCGNSRDFQNSEVKNTYVYTARTMGQTKDGVYKPLYRRLTEDFIKRYLLWRAGSIGKKLVRQKLADILNKEVSEWMRAAESNAFDNLILRDGDTIEQDAVHQGKIRINLKNQSELVDLEIEEE